MTTEGGSDFAQCMRCWKAFVGQGAHAELMRSPCSGHVAARIVRPLAWFVTVKGHRLWRSGPWVWCSRCGCHSQRRAVGLKLGCVPKGVRQSRELRDFREGRAPRMPASAGRVYQPERLTLASWMLLTGEAAPSEEDGPHEVDQATVEAEVASGELHVDPSGGSLWE